MRMHLIPFFGDRPLDGITPEQVDDLIAVLEGKGLAPKTIRNIIATLSALFNFAKAPRRRWAAINPCDGVELPAVARGDRDPVPDARRGGPADRPRARGMFHEIDRAM